MIIEGNNYTVLLSSPYNRLRYKEAIKKMFDNLHRVDVKDIEKLTEDYV